LYKIISLHFSQIYSTFNMIDYLPFSVPLTNIYLYGDITIAGCKIWASARRSGAFEQGGIFIMPHLL
jgi:hypothetical protein